MKSFLKSHSFALVLASLVVTVAGGTVLAEPDRTAQDRPELRRGRWILATGDAALPADMIRPAGRTRWDLTSLTGSSFEETRRLDGNRAHLSLDAGELRGNMQRRSSITSREGGEDASLWLFPERQPAALLMGATRELKLSRGEETTGHDLFITTRVIGVGWLDLPSGPREVTLQEASILETPHNGQGAPRLRSLYRWIDPRAGVVAWYEEPAADGKLQEPGTAAALEVILEGHSPMRLHVDELELTPLQQVTYGYDLARQTVNPPISAAIGDLEATLAAGATVGDLIALDFWDFSVVTDGDVTLTAVSPSVTEAETCNFDECGYTIPGMNLDREDRLVFDDPNDPTAASETIISHQITQTELQFEDSNNPSTPTSTITWLRAATQNENRSSSGLLATDGENRICYTGGGRTEVPLYRYGHQDAGGWYFETGDLPWSSGVFQCEQNINNEQCGSGGSFSSLYVAGATTGGDNCPYSGTQFTEVVKDGVLKLPSGHTFNAMLLRNVAEFCIYSADGCPGGFLGKLDEARTVTYLWLVPNIGTTVRLQSPQESGQECADGADPDLCFPNVTATDIKFGLFPPLTITADLPAATDTTVTIDWDPGLVTDRIDGFKVYWDTDTGGSTTYAFDSESNPGQVVFNGNQATLSGLTAGTDYFITVTTLSTLTNPSSGAMTTYESMLFPTQVSGDPSFIYPVEVMTATTGGAVCTPGETTGLVVSSQGGNDVEVCWGVPPEPCVIDHQMVRSNDRRFGLGCTFATTPATCLTDTTALAPGDVHYFLTRPFTPTVGTWGTDSSLVERSLVCAP